MNRISRSAKCAQINGKDYLLRIYLEYFIYIPASFIQSTVKYNITMNIVRVKNYQSIKLSVNLKEKLTLIESIKHYVDGRIW